MGRSHGRSRRKRFWNDGRKLHIWNLSRRYARCAFHTRHHHGTRKEHRLWTGHHRSRVPGGVFNRYGVRASGAFNNGGRRHFDFSDCFRGSGIHCNLLHDEPGVMSSNEAPVISARDLRVQYADREILHGINFEVKARETMVILGGSGSGKSTLLRTMVGLEKPTSGSVWVGGTDLSRASGRELDDVRKRIGLSFQGGALIGSLTIGENVALPLREHTDLEPSTIEVMVRIKLQQVGLLKFQHFMPSQLSGGMKKRAALARAMAMDPELLCFAEPSAGLDPIIAAGIDQLILTLKQALAVTIVVVTHEMASAFLIADRIIVLDGGYIVGIAPTEELKRSNHPRIRQ